MLGRKYTDKIEIWGNIEVSDGYGGYIHEPGKLKSVWAAKETKGAGYKFQQFGLNEFKNPVVFRVRAKIGVTFKEDTFVKYKGGRYEIKGIEKVNLEGLEVNIFADETKT